MLEAQGANSLAGITRSIKSVWKSGRLRSEFSADSVRYACGLQ